MPDEQTTEAPTGTEEQTSADTENQQPETQEPRTYTQEQYEAGVKRRLERERTKLRGEWEAERAEAERQAKLSEQERLKEEKTAIERERDEAKTELERERRTYALERQLVGKVVNVADALRLINPDDVAEDGTFDVDSFLEARPYLRINPEVLAVPSRGANGRTVVTGSKDDVNDAIRRMAGR